MALFGYPVAQENDAERAVRAALSIQRALVQLNRGNAGTSKPTLAARIAIELGPVVVDTAGEIFGDVPNIAARAQALAEPGAVVVTARVQRQVAGLFVAEELGSHELRGVPERVSLFRIVRASGGGRRSGQRQLTPLVGRDEEMAILMRRWDRARHGDGQLVLVVGEPGLGKSRLIEEFHARVRDTPHTWVEWSASQLLQNTPLHPVAEWGRVRFGGVDVSGERRLADLENTLAQVKLDPTENVPLLAPLLDIPLPPERSLVLAPEELRRRQLAALAGWVMAGARAQPVVLAFEDLHWGDPTTIDFLRGIAERGALVPLFFLTTTRPEYRPPWGMRSHHSTISLGPLDHQQVLHMVQELAARHALRREVVEDVWARTSGVPLFIEEVTRLLLERGEQGGTQAIPPTLQQSLMARLDRLGPSREVAQVGAVIGRGFSYSLLHAVAGMDDAPLQAALEKLADADIVLVQGLPPDSDYRFKHALIQDAAYENLLKSRRQALHRRVAGILRDKFPGIAAAEPEVLAYHFTQAGLDEPAIEWWGKAGDQALNRSAYVETIEHFGKAISLANGLATSPALRREQIRLQVALITPLIHVKGYAAPETKSATERARLLIEQSEALGERPEDPLLLFSILYGFAIANFAGFNGDALGDLARQFLDLAEKQKAVVPIMIGHRLMGHALVITGHIAEGRSHYDQVIALYDPAEHRPLAMRFGQDVLASILPFRALALWAQGYPDAAFADVDRVVKHAREINHAASLMLALSIGSLTYIYCGRYAEASKLSDEVVALADEKGIAGFKGLGMADRGWILASTGRPADAIATTISGIDGWQSTGGTLFLPAYLSGLARAYADLGQLGDAWRSIAQGMALMETTKQSFFEADVCRTAGEIARTSPDPDIAKAEAYLERAQTVARSQRAKSWELCAAMSMARTLARSG